MTISSCEMSEGVLLGVIVQDTEKNPAYRSLHRTHKQYSLKLTRQDNSLAYCDKDQDGLRELSEKAKGVYNNFYKMNLDQQGDNVDLESRNRGDSGDMFFNISLDRDKDDKKENLLKRFAKVKNSLISKVDQLKENKKLI